ncbi:HlyD family efflux transporter periplasmic adaptor subunit [Alcanivorax sp. S6407]|uniref:efflux RND transporter periplasmic adaptor subunit n=1 Tax=Alcanivorax sp. S6407 TaxID=2926424 RepID=UPI001FF48C89|nr:HlyD family efflux transporter periplasmic adaptor subunit [Alcanivorax sp. S6407]MCK0154186.1 HlyD family efflux transporter periplasmic adaptor subunit [Alcanivorax sp. S6407]
MRERLQQIPPVPRVILGTVVAIILLSVFKPSAPTQDVSEHYDRVRYVLADPAARAPQIQLFGRVQSPRAASLTAVVTANVADTPARAGSRVSEGDLLIQLDDTEAALARDRAQAARDEAQAQLDTTRLRYDSDRKNLELEKKLARLAADNLERLESLRGKKLVSQTQLDQAEEAKARADLSLAQRQLSVNDFRNELARMEARLASAEAQLKQAEIDLGRTRVAAPFAGTVTNVAVAPGERVRPGEPLVSLFADTELEVRAQIPDRHLPAIRDGLQQGDLTASTTLEGQTLTLNLKRLAGDAADARGGIDGLFEFVDGVPAAALGRPITITLTLPKLDHLLALPATALHGLNRLYRIDDDNRLQRVSAEIVGESMLGEQSVLLLRAPSLSGGERVMTTQLPQAIVGLPVDPRPVPGSNADTGTEPAAPTAEVEGE